MPAESSGYGRNRAVTVRSPQDFQENEAADRSLGGCMCNVTMTLDLSCNTQQVLAFIVR